MGAVICFPRVIAEGGSCIAMSSFQAGDLDIDSAAHAYYGAADNLIAAPCVMNVRPAREPATPIRLNLEGTPWDQHA